MAENPSPASAWTPALRHAITRPTVAIVMGVSGSGKTTAAMLLAAGLGWRFQEGDDLHPPANVDKMSHGIALTDEDRWPWLQQIAAVVDGWLGAGISGVLTCSALKRAYRQAIVGGRHGVQLVYLRGSHDLIRRRMAARHEHYMPVALLDSQFATLEEPTPDEHPIVVEVGGSPHEIVDEIVRQLEQHDQAA